MKGLRRPVLMAVLIGLPTMVSTGYAEPCDSELSPQFSSAPPAVTHATTVAYEERAAEDRLSAVRPAPRPGGSADQGDRGEQAAAARPGAYGVSGVIHDAEYYILKAQNQQVWAEEDEQVARALAALRKKYGRPPNIIHLMWNDQPFGSVGIPAMQPMRGYTTPRLNRMAAEGMLFTRMYSEIASTPTRSASMTGQHPVRNGMYRAGFPIGYRGLSADNVTIAEVLLRAGYATGFFGKFHLGDIEVAYPHRQGFDEAFFALYDHAVTQWNEKLESVNAAGYRQQELASNTGEPLDQSFLQRGYVFYMEGERGGETLEWCGTGDDCFVRFDAEAQRRALAFMRRYVACGKPFYLARWPLRNTLSQSLRVRRVIDELIGDMEQPSLDKAVGEVLDTLEALGIAENTLVIAMSANGPMIYEAFGHAGHREGPFRGGKGDFLEGGVRVSAQAWWPGFIAPQQLVNDMVHVTDLYSTFAHIAGATSHVPRDRIIDGIDQTALLVNGDGHGRRDYNFIYRGSELAATVKRGYKIQWLTEATGLDGQKTQVFDLLHDHREQNPMLVGSFQLKEPFRRMRARHEQWIKKYPHIVEAKGRAYTGLANARPETLRISRGIVEFQGLPFDPMGFIEHDLPFDATTVPGLGE